MLLDVLDRARERAADLVGLGGKLARGAQEALAFHHRLADEIARVGLGLAGGLADQRLRAGAGFAQGIDELDERGMRAVARLLQPFGFTREALRELARAR